MRKNVLKRKIFVNKETFQYVEKKIFFGQLVTINRINNNFEEVTNTIA